MLLWRERRWRELLALVDHLPRDSFFHEAMANDDELATQLVLLGVEPDERSERFSEWSPVRDAIERLVDAVNMNTAVTAATAGGKSSAPDTQPRPRGSYQRAMEERRVVVHRELVRRLLSG